jgi:hypothetical protein
MMDELICFCYGYTEEDIKRDLIDNKGRSSILESVAEARKKGTCECEEKHPQKR